MLERKNKIENQCKNNKIFKKKNQTWDILLGRFVISLESSLIFLGRFAIS